MKPAPRSLNLIRTATLLAIGLTLGLLNDVAAAASFLTPSLSNVVTEAGYCATGDCRTKQLTRVSPYRKVTRAVRRTARPALEAEEMAAPAATSSTSFDEKMGLMAYEEAVKGRRMADFRGGGWRKGNTSKSMCASVVKDVLLKMNVCQRRPGGHAYQMHGSGSLLKSCNNITPARTKNPRAAPKNSIIVYAGYAGKRPHTFGHVELKLQVTPALKRRMARDGYVKNVPVGGYIYCSDYCRSVPTISRRGTNPVAAIYEMN